jgi:hypothetical protein
VQSCLAEDAGVNPGVCPVKSGECDAELSLRFSESGMRRRGLIQIFKHTSTQQKAQPLRAGLFAFLA